MQPAEKSQLVNALIHYRQNKIQKERKVKTKKSVASDAPVRKEKKRNDDTTERDEQRECEEEESTSNIKEEESTTGMVTVDVDDKVASQNLKIIVDGVHLFHRVFWKGQTYIYKERYNQASSQVYEVKLWCCNNCI